MSTDHEIAEATKKIQSIIDATWNKAASADMGRMPVDIQTMADTIQDKLDAISRRLGPREVALRVVSVECSSDRAVTVTVESTHKEILDILFP